MTARRVWVAACGAETPWGSGMRALAAGLREGRVAIAPRAFDGIGELPVGACAAETDPDEDRTMGLLRGAYAEVSATVSRIADRVPPERRAVCAATSKGGIDLLLRRGELARAQLPGLLADAPARELARLAGASGPTGAIAGACATGLQNIMRGADWIRDGHADLAVAGSAESTLHPLYLAAFLNLGAMSKSACRPYDRARDGMVEGEGAAVVVLVEESALSRACLEPIAEVECWASMAEAFHPTAMDPSGDQVTRLLRALGGGADFLAAHGTGTAQNDAAEAAGIARVHPGVPAFSVKGAIGHLMGAAGSVEFAAAVAALRGGFVPPTPGCRDLADECAGLRVLASAESRRLRRALKWNLGFGGHVAGVALGAA